MPENTGHNMGDSLKEDANQIKQGADNVKAVHDTVKNLQNTSGSLPTRPNKPAGGSNPQNPANAAPGGVNSGMNAQAADKGGSGSQGKNAASPQNPSGGAKTPGSQPDAPGSTGGANPNPGANANSPPGASPSNSGNAVSNPRGGTQGATGGTNPGGNIGSPADGNALSKGVQAPSAARRGELSNQAAKNSAGDAAAKVGGKGAASSTSGGAQAASSKAGAAAAKSATSGGAKAAASNAGGAAGGKAVGAAVGSSAAASTAGGTAAGAGAAGGTAGSAAGPVGAIAGAAAGALIVGAVKRVAQAIIVIVLLVWLVISYFMHTPSFLFDNPAALNDRVALEATYNHFFTTTERQFHADMNRLWVGQMALAHIRSRDFMAIEHPLTTEDSPSWVPGWVHDGVDWIVNLWNYVPTIEFLGFEIASWTGTIGDDATLRAALSEPVNGHITINPDSINEIIMRVNQAYDRNDQYIDIFSSIYTLHSIDEYLDGLSMNVNMVLAAIDQTRPHWSVAIFEFVFNSLTNGWFGRIQHSLNMWWDGIWIDFVSWELHEISVETSYRIVCYGYYETTFCDDDDDGYTCSGHEVWVEDYRTYVTIIFRYIYDLRDHAFSHFVEAGNLTPEQIDRAVEVAHHLADLFGSHGSGLFVAPIMPRYFYTEVSGGGSVADNIRNALDRFRDEVEGMVYIPRNQPFPLRGFHDPTPSSVFGPRNFPRDPFHTGIDFAAPEGTEIVSIDDGIVLFTSTSGSGFGNRIAVFHGICPINGPVITFYAHLRESRFGPPFATAPGQRRPLQAGDRVSMGQTIGYVGTTGLSSGNHLHFQVHLGDDHRVVNPVLFFEFLDYLRPAGYSRMPTA